MRIKLLLKYLLEFVLSILIFGFVMLLVFKSTIFNENYVLNKLEETNYYELLHNRIKENMSYYIVQSGLRKDVLDDIFTKEDVKISFNSMVKSLYNDSKVTIDTSKIKEKLESNIDNYLSKTNIFVSDSSSLDMFVVEIEKVYKENISLSNMFNLVQSKFYKIYTIIDKLLIALAITIIVISILLLLVSKLNWVSIPFMTSGILLLISNLFVKYNVNIKNIVFYNDEVSELIKTFILDILNKISTYGLVLLTFGFVFCCFRVILINTSKK